MKERSIPGVSITTYEIENKEDFGLKEIENFISSTFEDELVSKLDGSYIPKFEKVELSLKDFEDESSDYRGGGYVILNVNAKLMDKLKESGILAKYQIDYKDTNGNSLFIKLILADIGQ